MANEHTPSESKLSDLEIALADIGNQVYAASRRIEQLEHEGKVDGNGHHKRQELALRAQILIYLSWKDEQEKDALSPTHPVKEALRREQ